MAINVTINRLQKQRVRVDLKDIDGQTDLTTTISVGGHTAAFDVVAVPGDNRAFDIVGQSIGAGSVALFALGKTDTANVTVVASPDMSSLTLSVEGTPVPK